MNITKTYEGDTLIVALEGELNTTSAPPLESAISEDLKKASAIVFDMTDLIYITSAGLRILLIAQQELEGRGDVIVRGARPEVRDVIEMTGFDLILTLE